MEASPLFRRDCAFALTMPWGYPASASASAHPKVWCHHGVDCEDHGSPVRETIYK